MADVLPPSPPSGKAAAARRQRARTLAAGLLALSAAAVLGGAGMERADAQSQAVPADPVVRRSAGAAAEQPFSQARTRGALVVGVPYLAPPAAAGAKIRTPERLDGVMARRLGERLGLPVTLRQVSAAEAPARLAAGEVDAVLADQVAGRSTPAEQAPGLARVPAGYAARPQAVIRSDTALRRWQDVAGRSVCMASAAVQAQELAARWGARVQTYRVPSDALVAVREGACDLGLIDDAVWSPLMRFPEWKKFSATLPAEGPRAQRVWLVAARDEAATTWLAAEMRDWTRTGVWREMTAQWARDVAFDVYLDQEVADCHG